MSESNKNETSTTQPPLVIKQSSGKGMALVLSLLALGASGFLFVEGQNLLKNQELSFNQKIDKAALGESQNALLLKDNIRKQSEVQALLNQITEDQKQNREQIAVNQRAYQELLKSRSNWLVDETEAMLNLASQHLMLTGNVPMVVNLLESVETRLNRFEQAELLPIKQAISSDLAALKSRPYIDATSTSLRLDRLKTAVDALPFLVDGVLQPGKEAPSTVDTSGLPWWQAAWGKALSSMKGMVEVRKLESNDKMLIAPEQVYFVRGNLRLHLLDARIALLQRNAKVYQNDLSSAEAAVKQYFDTRSPTTQSWLQELSDLKSLDINTINDDPLKASLNAIRAYQNSIGISQPITSPEVNNPVNPASEAITNDASGTVGNQASVPEKSVNPEQTEDRKTSEITTPKPDSAAQSRKIRA